MNFSKQQKEDLNPTLNKTSIKKKHSRKLNRLKSEQMSTSIEKYKEILKKSSFNSEIRKTKSEKYRAKAKARKLQQRNSSICASTQTLETYNVQKQKKSSFPEVLLIDFPFLSSPTHNEEISHLFDIFDSVLKANSNLN